MKSRGETVLLVIVILVLFIILLDFSRMKSAPQAAVDHVPHFATENLIYPNQSFNDDLFYGHVSLLVVWASWCPACRYENPILMKIKQKAHIPFYSLDYKDDPDTARAFLNNAGNPYDSTGSDPSGQIAKKFGVYGTPELFLIDRNGAVRYVELGTLTEEEWDSKVAPLIKQYSQTSPP